MMYSMSTMIRTEDKQTVVKTFTEATETPLQLSEQLLQPVALDKRVINCLWL